MNIQVLQSRIRLQQSRLRRARALDQLNLVDCQPRTTYQSNMDQSILIVSQPKVESIKLSCFTDTTLVVPDLPIKLIGPDTYLVVSEPSIELIENSLIGDFVIWTSERKFHKYFCGLCFAIAALGTLAFRAIADRHLRRIRARYSATGPIWRILPRLPSLARHGAP